MAELFTLGWQVASWIETLLCHGPGDIEGEQVVLDDEWLAVLARAYQLDLEAGRRTVDRYVLSRAKGRAKSELAGFLSCAEALGPVRFDHRAKRGETSWWGYEYETGEPVGRTPSRPMVRCLATELGQAGNTYQVVEYVLQEARIAEEIRGLDVGATRTFVPGGEIRPCTAGAESKDGGKETFAVADEIHLYVLPEHIRMHATVLRNLTKRREAQPWMLDTTTMFLPGQGSVAEVAHSYARDLESGKAKADAGFVHDHRQGPMPRRWNDDRQLRTALRQAYGPAAEWMDLDKIIREIRRPSTDLADAIRYFLNRPAKRDLDNWLKQWPGAWERCAAPRLTLAAADDVAAGVDMALRHDSASVVVAGRVGDRVVARARIFTAAPGGKIDFGAVKNAIRNAVVDDGARSVAYDPRFLELMAQDLEAEGVPMVEMPQAQPIDEPVLTPSGWVPIGQLVVGDMVIGSDGLPTRVTAVHDRGVMPVFELVFTDGAKARCTDDHLWVTASPTQRCNGSAGTIRTLGEIRRLGLTDRSGRGSQRFVPLVSPVGGPERELAVDPYVLGVLLGDGSFAGRATPRFTSTDRELVAAVALRLPDAVRVTPQGKSGVHFSLSSGLGAGLNPMTTALRRLGLDGVRGEDKFVPPDYLSGSPAQRLALLRGMMDTDGTADKKRGASYSTTSPGLRDGVASLARSLGGVATIRERPISGKMRHRSWVVHVALPVGINPFALRRKAERLHQRRKRPTRAMKAVTECGQQPVRCITIANPDGLYVTRDYVLTHNSPERMVSAFGHLVELIVDQRLAHDGDVEFASHVDAAVWRETERGRVLSKRAKDPIDAVYALCMACQELEQPTGAPPLVGSLMA